MILVIFITGLLLGALIYKICLYVQKKTISDLAASIIHEADIRAEACLQESESAIREEKQKQQAQIALQQAKQQRDQKLADEQLQRAKQRLSELEQKEKQLTHLEKELQRERALSKEQFLERIELQSQQELIQIYKNIEEKAQHRAQTLVVDAIQRISPPMHTDRLALSSPDLKAKVIGRSGTNYKTFKELAQVDLIVEEEWVIISSFDPERREIAKLALSTLLADGRITPQRIQEAVDAAKQQIETRSQTLGLEAAKHCTLSNLHPELLRLIGKMSLRQTLGQNLLNHSLEVSELMGLIAGELKLDAALARRIGLLHDIGKVMPSQNGLTHALAGKQLVERYGESEAVANGVGSHHDEIPAVTLEAKLCKGCDALSASRKAARQDDSADHLKRMSQMESIAMQCPGVEKALVFQGGKELYVFANAQSADATLFAKTVRETIEKQTCSPVCVTVELIS